MKKLFATSAIALLGMGISYGGMANAQTANPMSRQTTPMRSQSTMPAQNTMSPSSRTTASITTGQTIYDSSGSEVGTIKAVRTSVSGEQQAVVSVGKFLGIGGKDVEMPASDLTARSGGGYTTTLTSAEIKKLPEAPSSTTK